MSFSYYLSSQNSKILFSNYLSLKNQREIINCIIDGLTSLPKSIPSMFFYDSTGSKLFQKITQLPEYYLSRTEKELISIFSNSNKDILTNLDIIEFGSGDCSKISIILDALGTECFKNVYYKPIDVSLDALKESAECIVSKYPGINVHCIVADFLELVNFQYDNRKRLFCFFGSTIGNLSDEQRIAFFNKMGHIMKPGDQFLLGIDMVKDKNILINAYNDSSQITTLFNRNILNVVNSILKSSFNPLLFDHLVIYNNIFSRIELHLKAQKKMLVSSPYFSSDLIINPDETIHTENSYKFTIGLIENDIISFNLKIKNIIRDKNNWFSLLQIVKDD